MKNEDASKNMVKLSAAAGVLIAVNVAIWAFARSGNITPIGHVPLWGAFVLLNIISLVWAIAMLGLRPMVVAISYVTGGGVAYYAVQGAAGVPMPEAISAGAIYGAFGALTIGNFATKVRLAFFTKPQIPFVFIVVVLLVMDGMLNSQIFHADLGTIMKALVAPFVLAGGIIGVAEMMVTGTKQKTGRIHDEMPVMVQKNNAENKKMAMISDSGTSFRKLSVRKPAAKPAPKSAPQPAVAQAPKPAAAQPAQQVSMDDIPISIPFSPSKPKAEEKKAAQRQVTPEELLGTKTQIVPSAQPQAAAEGSDEKKKSEGGHLDLLNNIR